MDYCQLNFKTVKDAYPLSLIEKCIDDTLSGTLWFHTLDLASGYWQVVERDSSKTAFLAKYGLFDHVRMAQGLSIGNACSPTRPRMG